MSLTKLNIHNVRSINHLQLLPHSRFNIISGLNGSGKTSILEAIYLLSNGRSFRTRETTPLINYQQDNLTVYAELADEQSVSIQKSKNGATRVQLNHEPCKRSSELACFLPSQVVYQDIFQIIDAGPAIRRSLLDWGVFYQEDAYNGLLKEYRYVVKQRNALLRQKASRKDFIPWDKLLVEMALKIDSMRVNYFQRLGSVFQEFLARLTNTQCQINYYKGWDKKLSNKSLSAILDEQFASDLQRQYTHSGAHSADIIFDSVVLKAKHTLSRGQQKIILVALKLAQATLLEKNCVYLLDDVCAELDAEHLDNLCELITTIPGQFFLTTVDAKMLKSSSLLSEMQNFDLSDLCS